MMQVAPEVWMRTIQVSVRIIITICMNGKDKISKNFLFSGLNCCRDTFYFSFGNSCMYFGESADIRWNDISADLVWDDFNL